MERSPNFRDELNRRCKVSRSRSPGEYPGNLDRVNLPTHYLWQLGLRYLPQSSSPSVIGTLLARSPAISHGALRLWSGDAQIAMRVHDSVWSADIAPTAGHLDKRMARPTDQYRGGAVQSVNLMVTRLIARVPPRCAQLAAFGTIPLRPRRTEHFTPSFTKSSHAYHL